MLLGQFLIYLCRWYVKPMSNVRFETLLPLKYHNPVKSATNKGSSILHVMTERKLCDTTWNLFCLNDNGGLTRQMFWICFVVFARYMLFRLGRRRYWLFNLGQRDFYSSCNTCNLFGVISRKYLERNYINLVFYESDCINRLFQVKSARHGRDSVQGVFNRNEVYFIAFQISYCHLLASSYTKL